MIDWTIKIIIFFFIIFITIIFISYLFSTCYNIYLNFYMALDNGVQNMVYLY